MPECAQNNCQIFFLFFKPINIIWPIFHGTIKKRIYRFALNRIHPCSNKYPNGATNRLFCCYGAALRTSHMQKNTLEILTEQTGTRFFSKSAEHITFL